MEHLLNLFIKAIFVENVIFAFFLGMCSFLAVSKKIKTAFGLGLAVIFVMILTTPLNYLILTYLLKEGALAWIHPVGQSRFDFPILYLVHLHHRWCRPNCRDGGGKVYACALQFSRHILATYYCELLYFGNIAVYARARVQFCGDGGLFIGFRHRFFPSDRLISCYSRALEVFQYSRSTARTGHRHDHYRSDGYGFSKFFRYSTLKK